MSAMQTRQSWRSSVNSVTTINNTIRANICEPELESESWKMSNTNGFLIILMSVYRLQTRPVFRLQKRPVFGLQTRPVFRLQTRPVFRLQTRPVFQEVCHCKLKSELEVLRGRAISLYSSLLMAIVLCNAYPVV